MAIKKNFLIEKRNVLNEIRSNNMNLQELRFFSIYLAKINARDISTRIVRFPIKDFQKIMDMIRLNITQLQHTIDSLLCKIVSLPLENGGFTKFQLFKQCRFDKDENGDWYIEINAHDEALPLMFEFKDKYFTYELWNALRLKSSNQLRMYEILKQYEKLGERTILLDELKGLLGLNVSDYPRYDNFKMRVLDSSQEALSTYTDIKFTYEPVRKRGKGGKINAIRFIISRNNNYIDPLYLADFIDLPNTSTDDSMEIEFESERLEFLAGACNNEFNEAELQLFHDLIVQILPHKINETIKEFEIRAYNHLQHRYDELNWRSGQKEIKNRFAYLRKILEADIKENQEI